MRVKEAHGIALFLAADTESGYRGVSKSKNTWKAEDQREGTKVRFL